jgi:DNA transformation protein
MRVKPNEYLGYVLERLEPIGQVTVRAMFGGHGLYYRGVIFGLVIHDELYFKTGEGNILEYKAAGSSPFIYTGKHKPVTMSYWRLPEHVLEDDALLKQWVFAAHKISLAKKNAEKKQDA